MNSMRKAIKKGLYGGKGLYSSGRSLSVRPIRFRNSRGDMKKLLSVLVIISFVFIGCGPANQNAKPSSIQKAKILSQNKYSITIGHSTWGKPIAFRLAEEHCAKLGKIADYIGGARQPGWDIVSTWQCKE